MCTLYTYIYVGNICEESENRSEKKTEIQKEIQRLNVQNALRWIVSHSTRMWMWFDKTSRRPNGKQISQTLEGWKINSENSLQFHKHKNARLVWRFFFSIVSVIGETQFGHCVQKHNIHCASGFYLLMKLFEMLTIVAISFICNCPIWLAWPF